ncbi:MAG: hypothetical protein K2O14_14130 [Oscillospiraceae bacterium]|nr:hypothetical protein [Oscillospiraceae bacterium]
MKKYIVILAAVLTLSATLPANAETIEDEPSAVSYAEEISERDPMAAPEPNVSAYTSEPSDDSVPNIDTPMAFQRAEQGRGDIPDIISYWEENGYPENLSFIAETRSEMIDGVAYTNYDVGLVLDTDENRSAILDIAADNNLLRFTMGSTSISERSIYFEKLCYLAAQEKDLGFLEVCFYKNSDMIEVVVSGSEKTYYERFGKQFGGVAVFINERNTVTGVDNAGFTPGSSEDKVADYIQKTANAEIFHAAAFLTAYPDGWIGGSPIEIGENLDGALTVGIDGSGADIGRASPLEGTIGITPEPAKKSVPIRLLFVGAAAIILAAVIAVILRRRVKAGADGTAAAHRTSSAHGGAERELISAIKNAEEQPDPRLFEKIRDNITK